MKRTFLRPIRRFVLVLDDPPEYTADGIVVSTDLGTNNLDYYVVAVGTDEHVGFGVGDIVVLSDPNVGRKVVLDGVSYRLVRSTDIIGVEEP